MSTWAAGNYKGSGKSKEQYTGLSRSSGYKAPSKTAKISTTKSTSKKVWVPAQKAQGGPGMFPVAAQAGYWTDVPQTTYEQFSQAVDKRISDSKSSQRTQAAKAVTPKQTSTGDALNGMSFADASKQANGGTPKATYSQGTGPSSTDATWRDYLKQGLNVVKNTSPVFGSMVKGANALGFDLTNTLGIPTAQASMNLADLKDAPYTVPEATGTGGPGEIFYQDYVPVDTSGNPWDRYKPAEGKDINTQRANPINTQSDFITNPTSNIFNHGGSNISNTPTNGRSAQPVSNPTPTQAPTSNISNPIDAVVEALIKYGQPAKAEPDYTPVQQNPGTVQRQWGGGKMTSGQFANGAGGYDFSGSLGGNNGLNSGGMQDEQSIFNDLMGINTAQAEGFNMASPYQSASQTPYTSSPEYKSLMANLYPNGDTSQGYPKPPTATPTGGSQTGSGPTQQFAQGSPSQMQQGFDSSGYKAAQKAQEKALKELIKSIKGEYATSKTEGTTALEKSKQEDLLKLSGLFNFANQDPNSEQRMQYEQRSRNDYAGQLKDFLAKLAQGQSKDISGAKQGYQSSLADILQQEQSARNAYGQQQLTQRSRAMSGTSKTQKVSHNDIFSFVNESLANGAGWDEIAQGAAAQGVDTSTGSYLDQLLNQANKQGQWR